MLSFDFMPGKLLWSFMPSILLSFLSPMMSSGFYDLL